MKKHILLLAISIACFELAGKSQVRTGIEAGITAHKMTGRLAGDGRMGLMATLVLDANLGRNFSFYPTLSYVQKGVVEPHPQGTLIEKQYVALRYAELSPNFVYHIPISTGSSFFLGLGPSIDFNMPSKRVTVTGGVKAYNDILFGPTAENDVRGIDWGANVVLGWRTNGGFLISANYNKGIRDLSPENSTQETKNQYIGVQLGVFLNNGKK